MLCWTHGTKAHLSQEHGQNQLGQGLTLQGPVSHLHSQSMPTGPPRVTNSKNQGIGQVGKAL